MSRMPLPPNSQRKLDEMPLPPASSPSPLPHTPVRPPHALTDNELTFILDKHLSKAHRQDPNVIGFIGSYMRCRSVAQSARENKLTYAQGQSLRKRPDIHAAITGLTQKEVLKHGLDPSALVERMKEIAEIDPGDFQNEDGSYKISLMELPPEHRRAIRKFKVKNLFDTDPNGMSIKIGEIVEVEYWDKMKATELLGREADLFKETKVHQHDVTSNMANVLLASKERGEARMHDYRQLPPPTQEVVEVIDVESTEEK